MLRSPAFLLLALLVSPVFAQLEPLQGLNALQDVPLSDLSQPDPNPLGAIALALHPDDWKHAEGEHFIYHYVRSFVATRAAVEAEYNFRVIAAKLEQDPASTAQKSHIYLFDRPADWQEFQKAGQLEKWTGGIASGGSLFLLRDPANKSSGHTLGHEIAHLLVHRFYGDHVPSWLNEGFAEYVSRDARASYQRARGYLAKPHSYSLPPDQQIAPAELVALLSPPADRVEIFYDESERLVRFLEHTDPARFLRFFQAMGAGGTFDRSLLNTYAGTFASREDFQAKFLEYVAKDYGTVLQDQHD